VQQWSLIGTAVEELSSTLVPRPSLVAITINPEPTMVEVTLTANKRELCTLPPWASFDDIRIFFENSRVPCCTEYMGWPSSESTVCAVDPYRAGLCHNLKEGLAK
jgi:hypothetical protein